MAPHPREASSPPLLNETEEVDPQKDPEPGKSDSTRTLYLSVGGMQCAACSASVEKTLQRLEGVTYASVSVMSRHKGGANCGSCGGLGF